MNIDTERHVSTPKMRRFLKHLGNASERIREEKKIEKRKDFVQKIDHLSSTEHSVSHEELLRADAKTIESQIRKVLDIEKQMLEKQKEDELEIQKEEESIAQMRNEMGEITHALKSTQNIEIKNTQQNTDRIDQLTQMMNKLNEKISSLSGVRTSSDEKIRLTAQREKEEILKHEEKIKNAEQKLREKKIKEPSVFLIKAKNVPKKTITQEIEEVEEKVKPKSKAVLKRELKKYLRELEKHYTKMVKAGYHSKGDLSKIKRKITSLKKRLK